LWTCSFKAKVQRASYKFGTFMHWVFFKPTPDVAVDDVAQVLTPAVHTY
jgi:hypothetical protein